MTGARVGHTQKHTDNPPGKKKLGLEYILGRLCSIEYRGLITEYNLECKILKNIEVTTILPIYEDFASS